ncbi:MAG TPA: hypothetical protein VD788_00500, partial [Candidatus Polarisedimenticolaceae bacterium]|nr:hypothetical protein [Candidatus Polarisedimenticolaceae bacterium]
MDDSNEPPPPAHVPPPAAAYRWLGVFESLAVLLACVAVILALSVAELWLLAPRLYTAEFELVEQRHVGDGRASTTEELLEQLSRLGLDADADVRERRGRTLLSISGLRSADTIDGTVNGLLVESGFDAAEGRIRTGLDWQGMITRHPVLILGAQAIVLIAFGLAFSRLRVGPARERPRARASVAVAFGVAAGLAGFACALILGLLQELLGLSIEEQAWLLELLRDRDSLFAVAPLVAVVAP